MHKAKTGQSCGVKETPKDLALHTCFRSLTLALHILPLQEYLKEILEASDAKLLLFAHHKELLDGLEFTLNR